MVQRSYHTRFAGLRILRSLQVHNRASDPQRVKTPRQVPRRERTTPGCGPQESRTQVATMKKANAQEGRASDVDMLTPIPTVCPANDSSRVLLYQELPTSIPCDEAITRRRKE